MNGISVIICCHNSSDKIQDTLKPLANQQFTNEIPWEIVLVDNASTDQTAELAETIWTNTRAPLQIVFEPEPGLSKAKKAGINNAKYGFLCFIDDDNWVCSDWIERVFNIMVQHPEIAMCGGQGEPVFEVPPPAWFSRFEQSYAVGPQGTKAGYLNYPRGYSYGAGSTLRKSAWEYLQINGFEYLLSGRKGKSLSSGEDHELCSVLLLSGYKLWYDPNLRFRHYMPAARLSWSYLIELFRAFGQSDVILNIYDSYLMPENIWQRHINRFFLPSLFYSLYRLLKVFPGYLLAKMIKNEGSNAILYFNRLLFGFFEKLKYAGKYRSLVNTIKNATWTNMHKNNIKT